MRDGVNWILLNFSHMQFNQVEKKSNWLEHSNWNVVCTLMLYNHAERHNFFSPWEKYSSPESHQFNRKERIKKNWKNLKMKIQFEMHRHSQKIPIWWNDVWIWNTWCSGITCVRKCFCSYASNSSVWTPQTDN